MHILAISDFFKVVTMLERKGPRNHFLSKKCIGRLFHVLKENLLKATFLNFSNLFSTEFGDSEKRIKREICNIYCKIQNPNGASVRG